MFQKVINALENKRELAKVDSYVCSVCGNIVEGAPPETCPICDAPKANFFKSA